MLRPTILVVDDEGDLVDSTRDFLQRDPYNYIVLTARSAKEALRRCREEVVHVAIIDIRLVNGHDSTDLSGLLLAKQLDPSIAKIIQTGKQYDDPVALIRNVMGQDDEDIKADSFIWKRENPNLMIKKIESALKRMPLKLDLEITMRKPLDWSMLVNQIKILREKSPAERAKAEHVLQDLTCRLFHTADAIHFLRLTPGHSSCAVVLAQPTFSKASGKIWAVKFGPRENIEREIRNYTKFVADFVGDHSTQVKDQNAVHSQQMAAIAYSFIGGNVESVRDLASWYKQGDVSNEALCKTIDDLFSVTCELWYGGNVQPPEDEEEKLPIDRQYRKQLNLLDDAHLEELNAKFHKLLATKPHGRAFELLNNGLLKVKIEGRPVQTLPSPITFALEHKSSLRGSNFFEPPSKMAITHGDLHGSNVLVSRHGRTWLIDFYKTGRGPALRDFAELESDIKFDRLETKSLRVRYDLEQAVLAPTSLNPTEPLALGSYSLPQTTRALGAIQRLRSLAASLTDTEEAREYYIGLLFYALKRLAGFTSASGVEEDHALAQYHAILSAALICNKLTLSNPSKKGVVFLAHPYNAPWDERFYNRLKVFLTKRDYHVLHPLDHASYGLLWTPVAEMIRNSTANFFEISSVNGNVLFELGYTIGLRKPYFLLNDKGHVNSFILPSLLSGELRMDYSSEDQLRSHALRVLEKKRPASGHYFFEQSDFKRKAARVRMRRRSALLITANSRHQQKTVLPVLQLALEATGWQATIMPLEGELSISDYYLRLLQVELVVGCFASSKSAHISQANADVALALGIACGAGKEVIILQEKHAKILTDTMTLTKLFAGAGEAAKVLKAEIRKRFPRRYRKPSR